MKSILPLSMLLLTGCHTIPPTYILREVAGPAGPTNHLDVIRFPATYQTYWLGRRPDPANPAVMHEAHVIHVRESADRWNLNPAPASTPPVSTAGTAPANGAFAPLPLNDQLRLELQKQQQVSQTLTEQAQRVQQTADVLVPAARKAIDLTTQVQQRQGTIEDRLRRLEESRRPAPPVDWLRAAPTNR